MKCFLDNLINKIMDCDMIWRELIMYSPHPSKGYINPKVHNSQNTRVLRDLMGIIGVDLSRTISTINFFLRNGKMENG